MSADRLDPSNFLILVLFRLLRVPNWLFNVISWWSGMVLRGLAQLTSFWDDFSWWFGWCSMELLKIHVFVAKNLSYLITFPFFPNPLVSLSDKGRQPGKKLPYGEGRLEEWNLEPKPSKGEVEKHERRCKNEPTGKGDWLAGELLDELVHHLPTKHSIHNEAISRGHDQSPTGSTFS